MKGSTYPLKILRVRFFCLCFVLFWFVCVCVSVEECDDDLPLLYLRVASVVRGPDFIL